MGYKSIMLLVRQSRPAFSFGIYHLSVSSIAVVAYFVVVVAVVVVVVE